MIFPFFVGIKLIIHLFLAFLGYYYNQFNNFSINCNRTKKGGKKMFGYGYGCGCGYGYNYAIILVLFILLVIVLGARFFV